MYYIRLTGVPSNCSGDKKLTPLHYACYIGDADIAELLLKNKSCIHVNARASQEENYVTPLHLACSEGNLECVKLLLEHDALLDVRAGQRYETPLMALTGSLKVIYSLLIVTHLICSYQFHLRLSS